MHQVPGPRLYRSIVDVLPPGLRRRGGAVKRALRERIEPHLTLPFSELPTHQAVRVAYNVLLLREPDPAGEAHYVERLRVEGLPRERFLETLRGSDEFRSNVRRSDLLNSIHLGRCDFVQSLPRASRILDLGGTHQQNPAGAFVELGYPYPFERLVLVDLPIEDRHELYQHSEQAQAVASRLGPVEYAYHSMTDLSRYDDGSFDLVYSGQTIEHVTEEEADVVLREVARVLRPGGWLALDTPNGPACRLQQNEFINPDHKVEYSHAAFSRKLRDAGLDIREAKGLNYLGAPLARAEFRAEVVAANQGLYGEPQDCYVLTYLAQKPLA